MVQAEDRGPEDDRDVVAGGPSHQHLRSLRGRGGPAQGKASSPDCSTNCIELKRAGILSINITKRD